MTTLGTVLLVWAGLLVVLVAALALGTRRRRAPVLDEAERRGASGDRRRNEPDRRIGLPDLRIQRVERRSDRGDRRSATGDRRRTLGPVA
jgi:DNA phosphorothioation-dependent restriction protein DptG